MERLFKVLVLRTTRKRLPKSISLQSILVKCSLSSLLSGESEPSDIVRLTEQNRFGIMHTQENDRQREKKTMKTKYPIIENAKRQARMIFKGIAIPMLVEIPDDRITEDTDYVYGVTDQKRYVVSEKVLKFNRTSLKNIGKIRKEKADPRYVGGEDTMIISVGKPGSRERVDALRSQYEAIAAYGEEISPFSFKGEDE